jgi:hypothetical protein
VPIIPPHEILPGAMDVDMEWNRLGRCLYMTRLLYTCILDHSALCTSAE